MKPAPAAYDATRAASYWSGPRHESGDELASVLSLGEPPAVNRAYDAWESGLLLDALGDPSGEDAVDIGAGVGRVSVRVAPRVRRLACVDLAPGMLARLRSNAAREGVRNTDPVRARSDHLPFRSGSVGLVICLGLLEHLPRTVQSATLAEAVSGWMSSFRSSVVTTPPSSLRKACMRCGGSSAWWFCDAAISIPV